MGKRKHLDRIERLFEKSPVVFFDSLERIVNSSAYAKLLVSHLLRQGKIKRLSKGCYTKHEDAGLAVFCFQPGYLGLQAALSHHGLWEQETIPVILTTRKVRGGIRPVLGSNVLMRRISQNSFFGQETVQEGSFYLPYSNLEKTLIDFVLFRERLSPDVLKEMKKRIDFGKLKRYLARYPPKIRERVLRLLKQEKLRKD